MSKQRYTVKVPNLVAEGDFEERITESFEEVMQLKGLTPRQVYKKRKMRTKDRHKQFGLDHLVGNPSEYIKAWLAQNYLKA